MNFTGALKIYTHIIPSPGRWILSLGQCVVLTLSITFPFLVNCCRVNISNISVLFVFAFLCFNLAWFLDYSVWDFHLDCHPQTALLCVYLDVFTVTVDCVTISRVKGLREEAILKENGRPKVKMKCNLCPHVQRTLQVLFMLIDLKNRKPCQESTLNPAGVKRKQGLTFIFHLLMLKKLEFRGQGTEKNWFNSLFLISVIDECLFDVIKEPWG